MPMVMGLTGEAWFKGLSLHDDTSNKDIFIPNNNFDQDLMTNNPAAFTQYLGGKYGQSKNRPINKPIIDGEMGFNYPPTTFIPEVAKVWYEQTIWSQVDPSGVTLLPEAQANMIQNSDLTPNKLSAVVKPYQDFMQGIDLVNGKYQDALAQTNKTELHPMGQKQVQEDGKADTAHLWIQNKNYTWTAVEDNRFQFSDIPWVGGNSYPANSVVYISGHAYESLTNISGDIQWQNPVTSPGLWSRVSDTEAIIPEHRPIPPSPLLSLALSPSLTWNHLRRLSWSGGTLLLV
jgi:hypothetical protein